MSWNQPMCERCWINKNTTVHDDGSETIRRPFLMVGEHVTAEQCAWCGNQTIVGMFVREDPATLPYPTLEQAENKPGTWDDNGHFWPGVATTHTKDHHIENGPPFCKECSAKWQNYVTWPCRHAKETP